MRATRRRVYLADMDDWFGGFGAHFIALVVGGLGASMVPTFGARSRRAQELLGRTRGPVVWGTSLGLGALAAFGAWQIGSDLVATPTADLTTRPVPLLFLLGLCVGLPISAPGVIAAWSFARRTSAESARKRDFVPTKDDRRAFARKIVAQIQDVSPRPRDVTASISGDGGSVLRFEGDIDATEGERLTRALEEDLRDHGFKRVEGVRGGKEWWSRV